MMDLCLCYDFQSSASKMGFPRINKRSHLDYQLKITSGLSSLSSSEHKHTVNGKHRLRWVVGNSKFQQIIDALYYIFVRLHLD